MPRFLLHISRFMLHLVGALAALTLVACSSIRSGLSPEALQKRGLKPGEGLIVGTYDFRSIGPKSLGGIGAIQSCYVTAQPTDSGKKEQVIISGARGNGEGLGIFGVGAFGINPGPFAIAVPAGNYEIVRWGISAPGYGGHVTVSNRLPMKVPFQVKANEATYVGKMVVVSRSGKNLIGLPVFAEGLVLMANQYETDANAISKTFPTIRRDQIKNTDTAKRYLLDMKRVAETPNGWKQWLGF